MDRQTDTTDCVTFSANAVGNEIDNATTNIIRHRCHFYDFGASIQLSRPTYLPRSELGRQVCLITCTGDYKDTRRERSSAAVQAGRDRPRAERVFTAGHDELRHPDRHRRRLAAAVRPAVPRSVSRRRRRRRILPD